MCFSSATSTTGSLSPVSSCMQKVKESKWIDVALITGCVALLVMGILASTGVFNVMGTTNAAHFSYGMYGGAAFLFIVDVTKVAINKCAKNDTAKRVVKRFNLSEKEIQYIKAQAVSYASTNFVAFDYPYIKNPDGSGFAVDPRQQEADLAAQKELLEYINNIIDNPEYQENPVGYRKAWENKDPAEKKYPENRALAFFVEMSIYLLDNNKEVYLRLHNLGEYKQDN